jgi:hypothetical protein
MEAKDSVIDPKLRVFLMAVRAALIGLVGAIEKFIGYEEKKRS